MAQSTETSGPGSIETNSPAATPAAGTTDGGRTATATRPSPPRVDHLPPFRVLLHNDDVNELMDVIEHVSALAALARDRAVDVVLEAHRTGVALVLVTHRERAELYVDQFASVGLTTTIEPTEP